MANLFLGFACVVILFWHIVLFNWAHVNGLWDKLWEYLERGCYANKD